MKTSLEFEVAGERRINCSACEVRISTALSRLPGVDRVEASAATQRVLVSIDPDMLSAPQVTAALEELGDRSTQLGVELTRKEPR